MRILLVEDDQLLLEQNKEFITMYCKRKNLPLMLETAMNGKEAIVLCEKHYFDFIITDIDMPIMRGDELIAELKAKYPGSYKKIYVCSGYLPNEAKLENQVDAYFTKPARILSIIERLLKDYEYIKN